MTFPFSNTNNITKEEKERKGLDMEQDLFEINDNYYKFHPSKGYLEAKKYLQKIGKWEYVSTHGFSTDGLSIVATANHIWFKENKLCSNCGGSSEKYNKCSRACEIYYG